MKFDFRTEWSSWLMVALMAGIACLIDAWAIPAEWTVGSTLIYGLRMLAYPLIATAIATIPVLIVCWIMKVIPDLDYSIRAAFVFMLFLLANFYFF